MDRPIPIRNRARAALVRLLRDRRAGTAIEYGLILALVVLALMAALIGVADTTKDVWDNVSSKVQKAR